MWKGPTVPSSWQIHWKVSTLSSSENCVAFLLIGKIGQVKNQAYWQSKQLKTHSPHIHSPVWNGSIIKINQGTWFQQIIFPFLRNHWKCILSPCPSMALAQGLYPELKKNGSSGPSYKVTEIICLLHRQVCCFLLDEFLLETTWFLT